jgi:hypothetical protein
MSRNVKGDFSVGVGRKVHILLQFFAFRTDGSAHDLRSALLENAGLWTRGRYSMRRETQAETGEGREEGVEESLVGCTVEICPRIALLKRSIDNILRIISPSAPLTKAAY